LGHMAHLPSPAPHTITPAHFLQEEVVLIQQTHLLDWLRATDDTCPNDRLDPHTSQAIVLTA
ncbi:MAG: hypothetical protein JSW70_03545, partial [Syntrophobacterales bacterium]